MRNPRIRQKTSKNSSFVFWVLVLSAVSGMGWLVWDRYGRTMGSAENLPLQPSAKFTPSVPLDPREASGRLLSAINRRLEEMDILKLLARDVETRSILTQGRSMLGYHETFRLPERYEAQDLAQRLNEVSAQLGAVCFKAVREEMSQVHETRFSYDFGFSEDLTPVRVTFVRSHRPRVCIIIDDAGYLLGAPLSELYKLKIPLTLAVIPGLVQSSAVARLAEAHGLEVLCHMPMEGHEDPKSDRYPYFLKPGLTPPEMEKEVEAAVRGIPGCRGLNNHMGSRVTTDPEAMQRLCLILKARGLFFIDSRTSDRSQAAASARSVHLPMAERDVFLDNDPGIEAVAKQIDRLIARARRRGLAVGIGHLRPETVAALLEKVPTLKAQGIQFIFASEAVR